MSTTGAIAIGGFGGSEPGSLHASYKSFARSRETAVIRSVLFILHPPELPIAAVSFSEGCSYVLAEWKPKAARKVVDLVFVVWMGGYEPRLPRVHPIDASGYQVALSYETLHLLPCIWDDAWVEPARAFGFRYSFHKGGEEHPPRGQSSGYPLQAGEGQVGVRMGEHALGHGEIESDAEGVEREIFYEAEARSFYPCNVASQFALDPLLDEPPVRLDTEVVAGPQIGDKQPSGSERATAHVDQTVGFPEPGGQEQGYLYSG